MAALKKLSRRDFLKLSILSLGAFGLRPWRKLLALPQFPDADRLGRVTWNGEPLKTSPSTDSQTIRELAEDEVLPWLRTRVGVHPTELNQTYVETPEGYVWMPHFQPVQNRTNQPLPALPPSATGEGMWVEVSVPYVDLVLDNPPARAPWLDWRLKNGPPPRLYYSQITWVDGIRIDSDGSVWYRVNERYGTYGDVYWAAAQAFRPIQEDELSPIHPEVEEKHVVVDVNHQVLSCFEGQTEVYFCRISSGALYAASGNRVDTWETPLGSFPIWRKIVSLHMSGGTTGGGWDLPAIGWTTFFVGAGVAIHSTYWHNNFGVPMSNGCINARPEDAKWIFRWTQPAVSYDPGDISVSLPGGTVVNVIQA